MVDRLESRRSLVVSAALFVMTAGTVFLTAIVIWAIIVGDPGEDQINAKLDKQLALIEGIVKQSRVAQQAGSCTNFQNQRAIEASLRDIAERNHIQTGPPRVLPSRATLDACRASGVPVVDGFPVLGQLPR